MDLAKTLSKIRESKNIQLPPGVENFWTSNPDLRLRPYQIQMVWNMLLCPSFLCGDSPGLGKTICGSALIAAIKYAQPDTKFLVYTTSSAQRQWSEEAQRFTTLKVRTLNEKEKGFKTAEARKYDFQRFLLDDYDVLVLRYSTLLADGDFHVGSIPYWQKKVCLILDEASSFKSNKTITHQIVQRLSSVCAWKYGMSATPIENHLSEIRNIFQAIGVDALGSDEWFRSRYCEEEVQGYRSKWKYVDGKSRLVKEPITVTTGYKNLSELKDLLTPYFWARAQCEVGEQLPLLNTQVLPVEMNQLQKKKTDDIWAGLVTIEHLDPADGVTEELKVVDSKMTVLMLHQLVSINPALLSDQPIDYINAPTTPKEDTLIELLNTQLQGTKCIVYTRFRRELERLKHILPDATGRNVLYVHGDMDKDERYEMMQKFQNDPNETLICINQSAFQAVNLQQAANMICLDLPWAWGGMLQLIGRMVRLRSPHAMCNLFILKTVNTIDDHVIALLKNKKGIFERILSPAASLGVFDDTDHEPFKDSGQGFISKLFDTLTLSRHSYRQRLSGPPTL